MWLTFALCCAVASALGTVHVGALTEQDIRILVEEYNAAAVGHCNSEVQANWNVQTNVGEKQYEEVQVRRRWPSAKQSASVRDQIRCGRIWRR